MWQHLPRQPNSRRRPRREHHAGQKKAGMLHLQQAQGTGLRITQSLIAHHRGQSQQNLFIVIALLRAREHSNLAMDPS